MATGEGQASTQLPDPPTNAALGRAIRRLRKQQSISIEALALDADVHPTCLSGIERGGRNPTWSKLCDLASALGVAVSMIAVDAEREVVCPACGRRGTSPDRPGSGRRAHPSGPPQIVYGET